MPDLLLAEFDAPDRFVRALERLRAEGIAVRDAFTPYPLKAAEEAMALPRSRVPRYMFLFGMLGAGAAYFLQWWMNAYDYPLDVGGRPPHMVPAFIPITFEMGVLFACVAAVAAVLVYGRLPQLWHPLFEIEGFERASLDRFFILLEAHERATPLLEELGALGIKSASGAAP